MLPLKIALGVVVGGVALYLMQPLLGEIKNQLQYENCISNGYPAEYCDYALTIEKIYGR